ncbi:MAG TPA: hypothetical protein VFS20_14385 [Longimicrobium sp.]|nr:hypothetical protein [Longimicrobium sp.]
MSLGIDQLEVTSFETVDQPAPVAKPATPLPVCDSPLCVPSWNGSCPEAGC